MSILITIIVFLVVIEKEAFGYIDPGTGSLLFSALLGLIGTGFFLAKSLYIKMKNYSFSSTKAQKTTSKKARIIIYSEGKQYFNVFKPIVENLIKLNINFIYYTSSKDDPIFEIKNDLLHSEFIGEGNKAYARLNIIETDICLTTTPNIDVFQFKRSRGVKKYVHIVHMASETALYCLYSLDFYDAVLVNGENQIADIRELEALRGTNKKEIEIIGSTYLDEIAIKKEDLDKKESSKTNTTILLAPSWGINGILSTFGEKIIDSLLKSSFNIIVRPHPQTMISEKDIVDTLQSKYKDNAKIRWDFDKENIYSLHEADVLISDFSGIIFDYAFLFERPVLIPDFTFDKRGFDISDLRDESWTFKTLPKITIKLNDESFNNLESVIHKAITDKKLKENIKEIKDEAYMHRGESGYLGAKALVNMLDSIN